jgi:hypothetical protein
VDDEDIAMRLALHRAAHAQPKQPREEIRLVRADDDEVGVAPLGELHDLARGVAQRDFVLALETALGKERRRVP